MDDEDDYADLDLPPARGLPAPILFSVLMLVTIGCCGLTAPLALDLIFRR